MAFTAQKPFDVPRMNTNPGQTPLLQVRDATKQYAGVVAVQDISFNIYEDEIVGLIGPNGAGKTTLINLITGVAAPTHGSIYFDGVRLNKLRPYVISRKGIARTFQIMRPFASLSVLDNVAVGTMFGAGGRQRSTRAAFRKAEEILEFVKLIDRKNDPADSLTLVGRKRLELARALALEPRLLLLDEVMAGLRSAEIDEAIALIRAIHQRGITILVIEHVMKVILNVCQRVIVLDYGKKIAEGTPDEVTSNPNVIAAYLGTKRQRQGG
jgi:branched-chain amino acid transport system ATP-binding protein